MKSLRVCLICLSVDGADFAQGIFEPKEKVSLYFSPWHLHLEQDFSTDECKKLP